MAEYPGGKNDVPPLWTTDFILIMLVNLLVFVSFQMLLPTMPVYVQHLGASEDIVGLVMGILTITSVGIRPFAGRALDSRGRKSVYLFGLVTIILSIFAYDLLPTVAMVLFIRLIHGVGWGTASTAAGTIASDVIPKSRLGEGMGYYGLTTVISMAVAPVMGLQIIASLGFSALFYASATLCILAAVCALFITYPPISGPVPEPDRIGPQPALFEKSAYVPAVLIFFINLTYGAIVTFIALYAAQFNIRNIGIFFTIFALALLVSRPFFGRMIDRKGFDCAMIPGMICIGWSMLILYFAQNLSFFIGAAFLYGIGVGAVQPTLQTMAVFHVPPQRRGAANGTFMSGFDMGIGVGAIIWGLVAKVLGYGIMYLLAVTPVIIAFVLYFVLVKNRSSHPVPVGR
jgi:MFS family permease